MDNWTYTADLSPVFASGLRSSDQVLLVFYGLDTIANIVCDFIFVNPVEHPIRSPRLWPIDLLHGLTISFANTCLMFLSSRK
jgi:hypothetical protein